MGKHIRTYNARLKLSVFGEQVVKDVGDYLGFVRNVDWKNAEYSHKHRLFLDQQDRMNVLLLDFPGLEYEYGKTIIMRNNEQLELSKRTHADNVKQWGKDIVELSKRKQTRRVRNRVERLTVLCEGGFGVCFGGRDLFKKACRGDENAKRIWQSRRRFLDCNGRTGRLGGNDCIRINENGEVSVYIPQALWGQYGIKDNRHARVIVGTANYRRGWDTIKDRVRNKRAVSASIETTRKGKLQLRLTVPYTDAEQVDKALVEPNPNRVAAFDTNDKHLDAIILDKHGNRVGEPITIPYTRKNIRPCLTEMLEWGDANGVSEWFGEDLSRLGRAITRKNGKAGALNKTVSSIPTLQIKTFMSEQCSRRGVPFTQVNPSGTSKYASEWSWLFRVDTSIHEKASYLIGRRGLGLTIRSKVILPPGARARGFAHPKGSFTSKVVSPNQTEPSPNTTRFS